MKKIVLFGAGLSCSTLIKYLVDNASTKDWKITIATTSIEKALKKIGDSSHTSVYKINAIEEHEKREDLIKNADLVISMLPASFHSVIANDCITYKSHLVTASYVSEEMNSLHQKAMDAGIILMNEIGVDPGIDHMSAMEIIDEIKNNGGIINDFKSYCGGLIAPETSSNPWDYKFTWNPRNVVIAGKYGATFQKDSKTINLNYSNLFKETDTIQIPEYGTFESYGNRNSIPYKTLYNLQSASGIYRATLRRPGYSEAWNILVQLDFTNENKTYTRKENTFSSFTKQLFPDFEGDFKSSIEDKIGHKISTSAFDKIAWLDLFSNEELPLELTTTAQVLQYAMESKMMIKEGDKDMLVMQHVIDYNLNNKNYRRTSSMAFIGDGKQHTAMSQTVGLPVGIITKLILNNTIKLRGVQIPTKNEIYKPVLSELEEFNINFINETMEIR